MTTPVITRGRDGYSRLPRDDRWMDSNDSAYQVGGHCLEVTQVAYGLRHRIESQPILASDPHLMKLLAIMEAALAMAENTIDAVFYSANKRWEEANGPTQT